MSVKSGGTCGVRRHSPPEPPVDRASLEFSNLGLILKRNISVSQGDIGRGKKLREVSIITVSNNDGEMEAVVKFGKWKKIPKNAKRWRLKSGGIKGQINYAKKLGTLDVHIHTHPFKAEYRGHIPTTKTDFLGYSQMKKAASKDVTSYIRYVGGDGFTGWTQFSRRRAE